MAVEERIQQSLERAAEPSGTLMSGLIELRRSSTTSSRSTTSRLEIPRGSFFALLGPSGCGKTTTPADDRRLRGADRGRDLPRRPATSPGLPPYKRDVNTVFQSYALFPHLTIFENVAFGLRRDRARGEEIRNGRVEEMLDLVEL